MDTDHTTAPEPAPPLSALDAAVARHPASRGRGAHAAPDGYGLRSVKLSEPSTVPVYGDHDQRGAEGIVGYVDIPAVYGLECYRCGALFRPGSPFGLTHTLGHRWEAWGRRMRGRLVSMTRAFGRSGTAPAASRTTERAG